MADQKQFNGVVSFKNTVNADALLESKGTLKINDVEMISSAHLGNLMLGLNPHFVNNFGQPGVLDIASHSTTTQINDVKTPVNTLLKQSLALAKAASQTEVVSAAQASQIFSATGVVGTDVAIGTTGSPGTTPLTNLKVHRLTGGVSDTVQMAAGGALTADQQTLILFTGNTFASSGILKLLTSAGKGLDAESTEVVVTGDGTATLTRAAVPTDNDRNVVLTDTGDCTILAGSYLYFYARDTSADGITLKGCIRTSGGTIAVTYAAS